MAESASPFLVLVADIEGGRPGAIAERPLSTASDLRLLGDLQSVIDVDAQVPHG